MSAERELAEIIVAGLLAEYGEDRETWTELGSVKRIARSIIAAGWHSPEQHAQAVEKGRREAADACNEADRNGYLFLHPRGERVPWNDVADWLRARADGLAGGGE